MSDKQEKVGAAANTFAEIERTHESLKGLYDLLLHQIGDCVKSGVGKIDEGVEIRNDIEDARGRNSSALAKVVRTHRHCTRIAKREGCDVPPNLAIDDGLIQPFSTGR